MAISVDRRMKTEAASKARLFISPYALALLLLCLTVFSLPFFAFSRQCIKSYGRSGISDDGNEIMLQFRLYNECRDFEAHKYASQFKNVTVEVSSSRSIEIRELGEFDLQGRQKQLVQGKRLRLAPFRPAVLPRGREAFDGKRRVGRYDERIVRVRARRLGREGGGITFNVLEKGKRTYQYRFPVRSLPEKPSV